jgi:GntR family transcriptional regulator, histidine utilization repressor
MKKEQCLPEAAFRRIKQHVVDRVQRGEWREGDVIPTEVALAAEFGVSRMTANRALRELTDEQVLVRVQGSGTFVAQQKYQSTLVEIRSIAAEVAARGHVHRAQVHRLARVRASEALALAFEVAPGAALFHSVVVHFENDQPIQVEDRHVQPDLAPDYLQLDFTRTTANEYLMRVAPLQGVQYRLEALLPPAEVAGMLAMTVQQPCLVLWRKTQSLGRVASVATLWHPGDRYRFAGAF